MFSRYLHGRHSKRKGCLQQIPCHLARHCGRGHARTRCWKFRRI